MESRRSDPYTGDELYDSIFGSYKIKDVTQTIGVTNLSHVGVILTCYIWVRNCMIRIYESRTKSHTSELYVVYMSHEKYSSNYRSHELESRRVIPERYIWVANYMIRTIRVTN